MSIAQTSRISAPRWVIDSELVPIFRTDYDLIEIAEAIYHGGVARSLKLVEVVTMHSIATDTDFDV